MRLQFKVDGNDFLRAGEASATVKRNLKQLGIAASIVRKVAIAMYEAEMNMAIHGDGGEIDVIITEKMVDSLRKYITVGG